MVKTILIAEDDETLSGVLAEKLRDAGYTVVTAPDGEVALDMLRSHTPDLLLLDILMPRKNGMEVLEAMNQDPVLKKVPVIIISNSGQPVEIERAKSLGVRDFLVKAVFDPREVIEKIQTVFGAPNDAPPAPQMVYNTTATENPMATTKQTGAPILVVEDDKFLRELLIEKLLGSGLRVLGAIDGKEAFKILESEAPSLIVLDIILPDINGFEILQKIRESKKTEKVPVLILSNLDQKEDLDRAHALGVSGFMIKANFSLGEIVTKINSILAGTK